MIPDAASLPQIELNLYMKKYTETDCNDAATELLLHYGPIVRMTASKMSRSRPDLYEDLFQVGQMSMLQLFKRYDLTMGIPFEAYAMKCLIGHMKNYLRDKSWYIQVPRRVKEKGLLVQNGIADLTVMLERSPRIDEIAIYMDLSEEETIEILAGRNYYNHTSLDTPLSSEEDSGATMGDFIAVQGDAYETLEKKLDLQQAMEKLKPEEKKVLTLAFNEEHSQRNIAEQLGISQMSVSRIQSRAIAKLKGLLQDHTFHNRS